LTPEQQQKLDATGFPWNPREQHWERHYQELKVFREQFVIACAGCLSSAVWTLSCRPKENLDSLV